MICLLVVMCSFLKYASSVQEDRTLMVLAVFSVFPLEFVAMLEISTHVSELSGK